MLCLIILYLLWGLGSHKYMGVDLEIETYIIACMLRDESNVAAIMIVPPITEALSFACAWVTCDGHIGPYILCDIFNLWWTYFCLYVLQDIVRTGSMDDSYSLEV